MNHTAKVEPTKKEVPWKERVEAARKRLEALPTTDLINLFETINWDGDPEADVLYGVMEKRGPFESIENRLDACDDGIEKLEKVVGEKLDKALDRIDELWKALRTHHHAEGKVVREV